MAEVRRIARDFNREQPFLMGELERFCESKHVPFTPQEMFDFPQTTLKVAFQRAYLFGLMETNPELSKQELVKMSNIDRYHYNMARTKIAEELALMMTQDKNADPLYLPAIKAYLDYAQAIGYKDPIVDFKSVLTDELCRLGMGFEESYQTAHKLAERLYERLKENFSSPRNSREKKIK